MKDIAIKVSNVGKRYKTAGYRDRDNTIREALIHKTKQLCKQSLRKALPKTIVDHEKSTDFWALKEVSLDLYWGEALGIIGPNGSGKSTLLKILSRITRPTEGRIEIYGKVTSLLEIGTGFHPEMTGRENVFLNGIMLGMTKHELEDKFDQIAEFADIGRFIDEPVKKYSSGMYIRLAFSVAVHTEPNILLLDEVMSVGDINFQRKSMSMVQRLISGGRAVVIVSHALNNIAEMCQRAVLINSGRLICQGSAQEVVSQYTNKFVPQAKGSRSWSNPTEAPGNQWVRIMSVALFVDGNSTPTPNMEIGRNILIELKYRNLKSGTLLFTGVSIRSVSGQIVLTSANNPYQSITEDPWYGKEHPEGLFRSICCVPGQLLKEGQYTLSVLFGVGDQIIFEEHDILSFHVFDRIGYLQSLGHNLTAGIVMPRLPWKSEMLD